MHRARTRAVLGVRHSYVMPFFMSDSRLHSLICLYYTTVNVFSLDWSFPVRHGIQKKWRP